MEVFIARQPIFDQHLRVYAYELLFRYGLDNAFNLSDPNQASSKAIVDSFFLLGMRTITGGKKAFINMTRDLLVKEYASLLPREQVVVEIPKTVEPDPEVMAACRKLKQAGYHLVLNDSVYEERYTPLIDLADIIKVDFLAAGQEERSSLVRRLAPLGISLLAERVDTWQTFQEALEMGYTYFQGHFFIEPLILSAKDIPGFKLHYLRVLREIHQPRLDFGQLEEIIKLEMSLCYKFLRYVNSALFGWRRTINSIKHALVLLGEKEVKKWFSLIILAGMGKDKPDELVVQATIRARFCESLAPSLGLAHRRDDLFFLGLFSLIDAIIDRPLPDILREMPIAEDIKTALLGGENRLRDVYEYILTYENGEWEKLSEQAARLGIDEIEAPRLYLDALEWVYQSFQIL